MAVGDYVTDAGLIIPDVQTLNAQIGAELRAAIDPNFNIDPDSLEGLVVGVFASHERELWEALSIAFNAENPDAAEKWLLDNICRITGTQRAGATASSFVGPRKLQLTLGNNVTVPAGSLVSVVGHPETVVRTTENVTSTTAGPYLVAAECTVVGPIEIAANTLTVIQTPIVGWTAVTNPSDAIVGTLKEQDDDLRLRRERELNVAASGTPQAVTAALLAYTTDELVKPILDAITYENTGDLIDARGLSPHSLEALVYDGDTPSVDNSIVAGLIWKNRDGGIQTYGNTYGDTADYRGQTQRVYFSRPTILAVGASVTLVYDQSKPAPSSTQVKLALKARHDAQSKLGNTLLRWNIFDASAEDDVPGALGCTEVRVGPAGSLLSPFTNMPIPDRTKTTLSTIDIAVTLVPGTR